MRLVAVPLLFSIILVTCFLSTSSPPANAQPGVVLYAGRPLQVVLNDWQFLNVTVQDYYQGRTDMVALAVWKDTSGQTVAVETCGIALFGGEFGNCLIPVFNIISGTYFVSVFVVSIPYDEPLSIPLTLNASV